MKDAMTIPINEISNEDLADLKKIFNDRIRGPKICTIDCSDEAWERIETKAQEKELEAQIISFIDGQDATARCVRFLLEDRTTGVDDVIGFLADSGLEKDPRAAVIAMRVYADFIRHWQPIEMDKVVPILLVYYKSLGMALRAAGITI